MNIANGVIFDNVPHTMSITHENKTEVFTLTEFWTQSHLLMHVFPWDSDGYPLHINKEKPICCMKLKVCIVIILSWLNSVPEHNRDVCAYQTHTEHILFIR